MYNLGHSGIFVEELLLFNIKSYCCDVCGYQRRMGICRGFRAVAAKGKYLGFMGFKWCSSIQSILDSKGFSEVWNDSCIDIDYFKGIFAQRCNDILLQNWHTGINENSQCTNYSIFKQSLQIEDYLVQLDDDAKYTIAKFRTRSHHLPVTNNRFQSNNAEDTTCPLCQNGEIGDEFHYLLKCTYFNESRNKFLPGRI